MAGPKENHILIVDDEDNIRDTITEYFELQGFKVHAAADGQAMRDVLAGNPISVVLLDVRLPGEDGFSLCRYLRENHSVGILMLTGATDTIDRVLGLEIGADDYVPKPFDLRELLARVKSVLRRLEAAPATAPSADHPPQRSITVGDATLDVQAQQLHGPNGAAHTLSGMEFKLLMAFIDNPNRVLSRDQLLNATENRDWDPFDRSIDVRITRLRKKIEAKPAQPRYLRTVRGSGYIFVPDGNDKP